jgi:hypothetical protein
VEELDMVDPAATPAPVATPVAAPAAGRVARYCTIAAFACAVIALVLLPPIFALLAVVLGVVAATQGDKPLGWYAVGAGVAGGVIGMILGAIVFSAAG